MLQAHQTVVNLGSSMRDYFPIMEGVRHHAPSQHIPPTLSFRETCLRSAAVSRKPMPFIALEFCFHRQLTCTPASHALLFKTAYSARLNSGPRSFRWLSPPSLVSSDSTVSAATSSSYNFSPAAAVASEEKPACKVVETMVVTPLAAATRASPSGRKGSQGFPLTRHHLETHHSFSACKGK